MHYHAEVWIPNLDTPVEDQLAVILEKFDEEYFRRDEARTKTMTDDEIESYYESTRNPDGFFDWWQVGGRWTGVKSKYDPETDPKNVEICFICNGTGFRTDNLGNSEREKEPSYTCNACGTIDRETGKWGHSKFGPGKRVKWPTEWRRFEGDIQPVSAATDDWSAYTFVYDGKAYHQEEWNGKTFVAGTLEEDKGNVKKILEKLGITTGYLVTVDYHS